MTTDELVKSLTPEQAAAMNELLLEQRTSLVAAHEKGLQDLVDAKAEEVAGLRKAVEDKDTEKQAALEAAEIQKKAELAAAEATKQAALEAAETQRVADVKEKLALVEEERRKRIDAEMPERLKRAAAHRASAAAELAEAERLETGADIAAVAVEAELARKKR